MLRQILTGALALSLTFSTVNILQTSENTSVLHKADIGFSFGIGTGGWGWGRYPYRGSSFGIGYGNWRYYDGGGPFVGINLYGPYRTRGVPIESIRPQSGYYYDGQNTWATQDLFHDGGFRQVAPPANPTAVPQNPVIHTNR